jgi:hypothetical protein
VLCLPGPTIIAARRIAASPRVTARHTPTARE